MKLDEKSYTTLIKSDADVFTPEGELLCRFRKNILHAAHAQRAFPVLEKIYEVSKNRGLANGRLYMKKADEGYRKKDGTMSNYHFLGNEPGLGSSAVIGYMDRYPRYPYCRETAFNANEADKFKDVLPFLQSVDKAYRLIDPERYEKQMDWVRRTSKDFVIRGTSYTTVTVNQNWQTAVHTDQGDLKEGLSNILVLRAGEFQGAHLVFPHYRVAVALDTCDLLLFDSHHMHGNTPLYGKVGGYKRISLVLYYRERMIDCGTAEQELHRAKNRKLGSPLKGPIE